MVVHGRREVKGERVVAKLADDGKVHHVVLAVSGTVHLDLLVHQPAQNQNLRGMGRASELGGANEPHSRASGG